MLKPAAILLFWYRMCVSMKKKTGYRVHRSKVRFLHNIEEDVIRFPALKF